MVLLHSKHLEKATEIGKQTHSFVIPKENRLKVIAIIKLKLFVRHSEMNTFL